jgi:uncharacterized delta-60 repeat protein
MLRFLSCFGFVAVFCLSLAGPACAQSPDSFNPGADGSVRALALQTDGKVLAAGRFYSSLGGQERHYIGRLNSDGSVDLSYNPGADSEVYCLVRQADGKAVVGGAFTTLADQPCNCLGRLDANGVLDSDFNAEANSYVYCLGLQPDGKMLAGGSFSMLGTGGCSRFGRINPDGSLDTNFNAGADSAVYALAVQQDGKVLAGGSFTTLSGRKCANLGRVNSDGSADTNFNAGANGIIFCIALQADGKILVGGNFTSLAGMPCTNLGRLFPDGSPDPSFFAGTDGPVYSIALQADGMIFVGGSFSVLNGEACSNFGRLYSYGLVDLSFSPGADDSVFALAIQEDGGVLAGGDFLSLVGSSRLRIGRLSNTTTATQSLAFGGSTVTWLRGGASPEVLSTTFDFATNGSDWTMLGAGSRISGGWQFTGVSLPANASVRARGFAAGGYHNGSAWVIEAIAGPAIISRQPASVDADAGATITFDVLAGGTPPLSYRWRRNGVALDDGGSVSGALTSVLVLTNVLGGNSGNYSVVITNASGSVTSVVATLTVHDPAITRQPANAEAIAGQPAAFTIVAIGTAPLTWQWRKNLTNYLAGATNATLTVTNAQGPDAGIYDVVVSSPYGSATSAVALLTVDVATPDAFNPGPNDKVYAIAPQADGRIIAGGAFTNLGGLPRIRLGRLNVDGSVDTNFNASATGSGAKVSCLALQPDGKVLVGGFFTALSGRACTNLGRLNTDGSFDTNFTAQATGTGSAQVFSLALQPDGKILVGGLFNSLAAQACTNLGRLNSSGSLDTNFSTVGTGSGGSQVFCIALQPDGKLLVGGSFTRLSGQGTTNLGRLNSDGSFDATFPVSANSSGYVTCLAIQEDGKVLAGGNFTSLNGYSRSCLGRFNTNGTVDMSFNPSANNYVLSIAIQTDGRIIAGGQFATMGGKPHTNFCRLSAGGVADAFFDPQVSGGFVYGLALQADGKVLIGGAFTNLGGVGRTFLGRLNNTDPATQTVSCDGSTALWQRSGSGPEVARVTFDSSTDGTHWLALGTASRIPGGWQLGGLAVPNGATIRARGWTSGGWQNGSSWFVQATGQVSGTPQPQLTILINDGGFGVRSNRFGFNVSGLSGQIVIIEASADFAYWTPIQTNVITGTGVISFKDPQFGLFARRFYRARIFNGSLPPPSILTADGHFGFQSGVYAFNLTGISGQSILIQASTNLVNWVPLATNTLGDVPFYFNDPAATNFSRRFYRALGL